MNKLLVDSLHDGQILRIRLNDGKGNVIDHVMTEELQFVLDGLNEKHDLKLIIFEGEGKHFSFGASVEEHQKEFAEGMIKNFHRLFLTIRDLSVPTMARVTGQCLGGGMELALICNFIFADKSAKFGQPEIVLGVFPPPASVLLPLKIGYARAEELLLTGKIITAEEGARLGLVNTVYENKEELFEKTEEWIATYILPKSASSLRYGVKSTRIKFNHILGNFLAQLEYIYLKQLMNTNDANEGIKAFMEKRTPVWENR